jgi:hypothetical protein
MKKFFILVILFSLTSCYARSCYVKPVKQQQAQSMYNAFGTSVISVTPEQGFKLFGDCYRPYDYVYVYKTLWGKKYILARYGEVITYSEEDLEEEKNTKPQPTQPMQSSQGQFQQENQIQQVPQLRKW